MVLDVNEFAVLECRLGVGHWSMSVSHSWVWVIVRLLCASRVRVCMYLTELDIKVCMYLTELDR